MKKFLTKTLIFLLPVIIVYAAVLGVVFLRSGNQCLDIEMPLDIETVIIGDSHTECAINDKKLPLTQNISRSSESYYYSYIKLRYLFGVRPQIKNVIIGVSYHNTSAYIDAFIFGNYSSAIIQKYYPILNVQDKVKLLWYNPDLVADKKILLTGLKQFYNCKKYSDIGWMGGYLDFESARSLNKDDVIARVKSQFFKAGSEESIGSHSMTYLEKIVELCEQQGKNVYFISTPVHSLYRESIPQKFRDKYDALSDDYSGRVRVINMDTLVAIPDEYFLPDGDHITPRGAVLATEALKASLKDIY